MPWRELLHPPRRDQLTAEEQCTITDRQVQVSSRLVPVFHVAHLLVVAAIAAFVIPPSAFRTWWTVGIVAVSLASIRVWLPRSRVPDRRAGRHDLSLLMAEASVHGAFHGMLGFYCYGRIDADAMHLLTPMLAGILGAGALAMLTTRAVGLTWVATQALGHTATFALLGTRTFLILLAVLWVYSTILAFGVTYQSASFIRRCLAEHAAEHRMSIVEMLLDDVEGGARDWLWEADGDGHLHQVSGRFAEALGVATTDLEGCHLADVVEAGLPATAGIGGSAADRLREHLERLEPFRDLVVGVRVAGDLRLISLSGELVQRGAGPPTWRGVGSDVTDSVRHQAEIARLANSDDLTGLANRHRFQVDLDERLATRPPDGEVHLAVLDLDDFKSVNDTHGHQAGDRLLTTLAGRLAAIAGPSSVCSRIGGDEFAVVVSVPEPDETAVDWSRFLSVFEEPFTFDDLRLRSSGCIGHAVLPHDASTADELVQAADLALYRAKGHGPSTIRAFDEDLLTEARRRWTVRDELTRAIDASQLVVHLQPQVSTRSSQVIGFEALVRWEHPTRGLLSPGAFIGVAEETGLIVPLGDVVFRLACAEARRLPPALTVAVNVSAVQLSSPGLVDDLAAVVAEEGISFERLELEVTESVLVDEPSVEVLRLLRSLGARVSVDDFGTGYSSLAALRRLPVDTLKIDRSFVSPLTADDLQARAMVTAIVELADALGLATVAEGVETTEQRELIRLLGCGALQGFVESRPLPPDAVPGYLASRPGPGAALAPTARSSAR